MKVYSYSNKNDLSAEGLFTDNSPIQFLQGFALFYQRYHGNEVKIFYHTELQAYLPIRYFKLKMFQFGQLLHAPIRNNEELSAAEQQQFFEDLIVFLKKEAVIERLIQPHPFGISKAVPQGAQSCPFGSYINQLDQFTEEELLFSFDPKYRKAVNNTEKNGAVVKFGWDHLADFYSMYQQTTERAGIHCDPIAYFTTIRECMGDDHCEVGVIYDDGRPIGSIFMIYSKYASLCTHAGSGGESKLYGGVKMLHYEMMKRMKAKGVHKYDLVGVRINSNNESLEGIFRFKKGFGGELKEGYLWKKDIARVSTKVFDLVMRIRHRNAGGMKDIIDEESN